MTILGIETATERLSVALLIENDTLERHTDSKSSHCELINGFVSELLLERALYFENIDCVAVSIGPGSFTGLRIGIASAMGFAYAAGKPACGINTLMGIAWYSGFPGTLVCPLIDAKRSEAYTALYRLGTDAPHEIIPPSALPLSELIRILEMQDEQVTITGPATSVFRNILNESNADLVFVDPDESKPSAISIAQLGRIYYNAGKSLHPSDIKPLYLRRSDAEILREKQCRQS